MTDRDSLLAAGRRASEVGAWADAQEAFREAARLGPLDAGDLASLGEAAWWRGEIDECLDAMENAYRLLSSRDPSSREAGRLALEIGYHWHLRGEESIGSGWFSRAARILDPQPDSVEYGYLLTLAMDAAIDRDDLDEAIGVAREVLSLGRRHGDETLEAMGLVGEGIATTKRGDAAHGLTMLDEAMLPVVAGRLPAAYAGNIYCQLMQVCNELADYRRAHQWTETTQRWCEGFESAVMFVGICRLHRAQLLQRGGEWDRAAAEAKQVCSELAGINVGTVAEAQYELAELERLRGHLDAATEHYREARLGGRVPQPGEALLDLAKGRIDTAVRAIASAVAQESGTLERAPLWAAQVDIAVAAGDLETAEQAASRLGEAADRFGSSGLLAQAAQARGAVSLAKGDAADAVTELNDAMRRWRDAGAIHPAAQAQVMLAMAHRAAGDEHSSTAELSAAATQFERLGAHSDLDNLRRLNTRAVPDGGLSQREAEVLRLVAQGKTNRQVASELFLSEKTVARHLHNIFTKLDVSSRTAAAAYAFEKGLVTGPP